jgi:hypothetical protein
VVFQGGRSDGRHLPHQEIGFVRVGWIVHNS